MAARPGYAQPDPRNPFSNPPMPQQYPQQYQQRRRDYDAESDMSDPYGSRNTSTTHLTANSPYYDQAGQFDHSEYLSPFIFVLLLSPLNSNPFPGFHYC
jgi:1,3-beta-glucan synthase